MYLRLSWTYWNKLSIPFRMLLLEELKKKEGRIDVFQFLLGCYRKKCGKNGGGSTLSIPFRMLRSGNERKSSELSLSIPFRMLLLQAVFRLARAQQTFNSF